MEKYIITGGNRLNGKVRISGAKNAAVAILPATLLVAGKCHLENVPNISDIRAFVKILESLGSKIEYLSEHEMIIDNTNVHTTVAPYDLTIAAQLKRDKEKSRYKFEDDRQALAADIMAQKSNNK